MIAVARTILQSAWHVLKEEVDDKELGGDYLDHLNEEKTTKYFVKRLEKFGYEVELRPKKDKPATAELKPKQAQKAKLGRKPKPAKETTV